MEKQGVIKAGLTPPEHEPEKVAAQIDIKKPSAVELDADFRKRAADAARDTVKK
jgi:hypothetical protein